MGYFLFEFEKCIYFIIIIVSHEVKNVAIRLD